jgi:hypothetical protein
MISKIFQIVDTGETANSMDEKLYTKLTGQKDIRLFIEKFDETVQTNAGKHANA